MFIDYQEKLVGLTTFSLATILSSSPSLSYSETVGKAIINLFFALLAVVATHFLKIGLNMFCKKFKIGTYKK